jgi:DNA-3-methyladenine glycosylase II
MEADFSQPIRVLAEDERLAQILIGREIPSIAPSRDSAFQALSRSVVGQQLSVSAARTIWGRCKSLVRGWTPGRVLATPPAILRSAGVSAAKTRTLHELASYFSSGNRLSRLSSMSDDAVRS